MDQNVSKMYTKNLMAGKIQVKYLGLDNMLEKQFVRRLTEYGVILDLFSKTTEILIPWSRVLEVVTERDAIK